TLFPVCVGRGLDQRHVAVFAMHVQAAVGVQYRSPGGAFGLPPDLAGVKLGRYHPLRISAVQVLAQQHLPAEGVRHVALEIDFLGGHSLVCSGQLEQHATGAPGVGAVDIAVSSDWSGYVGWTLARLLVTPEELARLGVHSHDALAQELDILPAACGLDRDGRSIARRIAARYGGFPDHRAGFLVERYYRRPAAAGCHQPHLSIDQPRSV